MFPVDSPAREFPLEPFDAELLWRLCQGVELHERPFALLAPILGRPEARIMERMHWLHSQRIIRYFGPIFFDEAYGGGLSLAAMRVPVEELDRVSAELVAEPSVIHLISCRHPVNLWFTLAGRGRAAKEEAARAIGARCGHPVLFLPSLGDDQAGRAGERTRDPAAAILSELDWRLIEAGREGLPLSGCPYLALADRLGLSHDELLTRLQRLARQGLLLRVAAIPDYCRLGWRAYGLAVWNLEEGTLPRAKRDIASQAFVGQCTLRARHPELWPYNLYTIIHGRSRREVRARCDGIARALGPACAGYELLFRLRTLKKSADWPLQGVG